jgi:hypothetical protein
MTTPEAARGDAPRGTIYDLGYKRYVGTRRPQATRWRVITRQQLAFAGKKWWRYKAWLGLAILITAVLGAIMVVADINELGNLRRAGDAVPIVDEIVFSGIDLFTKVAFLLTLTVGVSIVASDLKTGAFTFYFSRPVRPVDYVLGKLVALLVLHATVILLPLLGIVGVRLGLSQTSTELVENLRYVPRTLLLGGLGALVFASMSLGFSALFTTPRLNIANWAIYYVVIGGIIEAIAVFTGAPPAVGVVDPHFALMSLSFEMYGVAYKSSDQFVSASLTWSVIGLVGMSAIGIAIAYVRVNRAAHAGIGGT